MATLFQKREALRQFYAQGIKPADDRRPISEETAQKMVNQLVDLGVAKDAPIAVFDTFLTLCLTLQEYGFTNLTLIERANVRLTNTQQRYYDNIKGICEKVQINYYIPPFNKVSRCPMKFTVVIGNPPYQAGTKSSGNTIWDKIVAESLELLEDGGYLSFINPPRWRQPEDELSYIYKDYQLVSLKINDAKEGKKVFKASTPFDVYTIQKTAPYKKSYIEFSDGVSGEYDVTNFPFIPNSMIDFWMEAFECDDEKLSAMWTYSHDPRLKHVFTEENKPENAIYPLTHTFTKKGITKRYTTKQHEYQHVSKVIFGDSGEIQPIFDSGEYGCTQHSIFIPVGDKEEGNKVINFLTNKPEIIKSITFSHRQFGPKPLNSLPKSFL